ncbi:MAG: cupin domain-containing protein [Pseudomonadota bacterium]
MQITPLDGNPQTSGPAEYFTGEVRMSTIVRAPEPARVRALVVSFQPGARTAWHTHPLGQTLYVTAGLGRVQLEGEPVQVIRPGDSVWIAPGERHWHGAAPDHAMTHVAIQEADETGSNVTWLEHVSDADYLG